MTFCKSNIDNLFLYVVAPIKGITTEGMPFFIVIAENKNQCLEMVLNDYAKGHKHLIQTVKEEMEIIEEIPMTSIEDKPRIVWGNEIEDIRIESNRI